MLKLFLLTLLISSIGLGVGGYFSYRVSRNNENIIKILLSFASGALLSLVFFDLIEEAFHTEINHYLILICIFIGYMINHFIHSLMHDDNHDHTNISNKVGIGMLIAVALHNIPEGMSIGATFIAHNSMINESVLTLALMIAIHNIPLGMIITTSFISSGTKPFKAIAYSTISGLPTLLGMFIGYIFNDLGNIGMMLILTFASGTILYIIFAELLPHINNSKNHHSNMIYIILGILIGMLILHNHTHM